MTTCEVQIGIGIKHETPHPAGTLRETGAGSLKEGIKHNE